LLENRLQEAELRKINTTLEEKVISRTNALVESEQLFKSTFESATIGMCLTGADGSFKMVNPAMCNILGYSEKELISKTFAEVTYPDDLDLSFSKVKSILDGAKQSAHFIKRYIHSSGRIIWSSIGTFLVRDDNGKPKYFVTHLEDITGRKQIEEALENILTFKTGVTCHLTSLPRKNKNDDIIGTFGVARDITERLKSENALKTSEARLKKAQEIGKIGSWELDFQNNELLWTDENYRIFGLPIGTQLTYETFLNCIHPEDRQYVANEWKATLSGKPYDIEHRILVNGKVKWIREKAEVTFNENGDCITGAGVAQDISQRKHEEERYRQTVESSIDGFWIVGTNGKLLNVNDAYCNMTGYSRNELLDMSIIDVEASLSKYEIDQRIQLIIAEGSDRFETQHRHVNGNIIDVEISTTYTEENGGVFFVFIRDITERKVSERLLVESEQRFKELFDNAPLSYQTLDDQGNFIEVNATWLSVLGYTKADVIGRDIVDFLHPNWKNRFIANFSRIKAGEKMLSVEFAMLKKDGSSIMVSFHGKIAQTTHGKFKQLHCVFRDITRQKQIESEKKVLEARLLQTQKMESIGNLAGGIAHDFNNILFPIIGLSEMLMEDLPQDSMEYDNAREILQAGLRGKDIVQQILSFSRQTEHKKLPIKAQTVLTEVIKLSRSTIPSNIVIEHDIQNDCSPIKADPTQLHQIAMNLITNAYHAVEHSDGKISVLLREITINEGDFPESSLPSGKYANICVSDTGCGISTDVIDKIFDPYFTTKEQGKGTGLGLAVVYGIIKGHDGDIKVFSEDGKGTSFSVYLPLMMKSFEPISNLNKKIYETGTERILLVDDDKSIANLEFKALKRLGYHVTFYTDSLKALTHFSETPFNYDLIITDMAMPNLPGDKLAKELISINPDIPIIICTGYSERLNDEKAKDIGIKGFLMKPVIKSQLASMVRKVLDENIGKLNSKNFL